MIDQSLGLVGLSYKSAPVHIRESLTLLPRQKSEFFDGARTVLDGLAVLSTCNRVEFYGHAKGSEHAAESLQSLLNHAFDLSAAQPYLYCKRTGEVPRHLMRVACGLESMVLGESQILGQVSESLLSSESASLASPELRTLFRAAVKAGKRVRKETALGQFPVSVASVAIERILQETGSLRDLHVAVIGAGEMGNLVGKHLRKKSIGQLTLINRNPERIRELEVEACVQAVPMEELREAVSHADVVISATDAPHMILGPEHIAPRKNRPLLLMDLAVPRDIDPFLDELSHVKCLDIDHLKHDIAHARAARKAEVPMVEDIIDKELDLLRQRLQMLKIEPVITALRKKAESIRQAELSRIMEALGPLEAPVAERLEYFSSTLVKKLLHEPTRHLRHGETDLDPNTIRQLFGLSESSSDE